MAAGQDIAAYMHEGIVNASRVILICSDKYVAKAEGGFGGVGYERLIITAEVVEKIDTRKFIPAIRSNPSPIKVPRFLGPRKYIDFSDDAAYELRREELLREILGAPAVVKPGLGPNPFSGQPAAAATSSRSAGPTGITRTGEELLEDKWFLQEFTTANSGISNFKAPGSMELRIGLHDTVRKSQIELLNSVRNSQITTFGWPIAVVLDNREEYRPRPYRDGIRAEISIDHRSLSGRSSYDYWAVRENGDFYLLQSLFEDQVGKGKIFFNTRIVRIAESLLFASRFYTNLGVSTGSLLSVRVTHRGLANRELGSAGMTRMVIPRKCTEQEAMSQIVIELGKIESLLVDYVEQLIAPMFMLFEFQTFNKEIYMDVVRRFEKGEVT